MKLFKMLPNIIIAGSAPDNPWMPGPNDWVKAVEDAKPFIVHINNDTYIPLIKKVPNAEVLTWLGKGLLKNGMPFETCFFESFHPGLGKNQYKSLFITPETESTPRIKIFGVLIADKPRGHVFAICMIEGDDVPCVFQSYLDELDKAPPETRLVIHTAVTGIERLLEKLKNNEFTEGVEHHRKKISNKEKTINRRIGDLIYLIPNKHSKNPPMGLRHINFSHRFLRRGHWRIITGNSIGKNRNGERTEVGRTWVNHSEVGDKILPFKNKVRVLKD